VEDIVIVTDTHLGVSKDSPIWHKVTIDLFKDILDTCLKKNIKRIIHLGDWFDNRKALGVRTLSTSLSIAQMIRESNVELEVVLGNHDMFYKNQVRPNSLEIFSLYDNVTIHEEVNQFMDGIFIVPWLSSIDDIGRSATLFGHFEINGFDFGNGRICNSKKLSKSRFKEFKQVISGHFHKPQVEDNITYVGAPFQTTFNDIEQIRGYNIYNGELKFIEFTNSPKFKYLKSSDVLDENFDKRDITGNIVKIIYTKDHGNVDNDKVMNNVQIHKPLQLHTNLSKIIIDDENETIEDDIL
jgi:DNA repair exonuclease SbcCD nuclease subunit